LTFGSSQTAPHFIVRALLQQAAQATSGNHHRRGNPNWNIRNVGSFFCGAIALRLDFIFGSRRNVPSATATFLDDVRVMRLTTLEDTCAARSNSDDRLGDIDSPSDYVFMTDQHL